MGSLVWKGVTTLRRYEWMTEVVPAVLINAFGQPVVEGQYNGETVIAANHDGSVMMPQATGPPVGASTVVLPYGTGDNDIYSAYVQQSPWTEQ